MRLVLVLALMLAGAVPVAATAATSRPNAVDVRVDHLSNSILLARPASALVDPERQVAARRLDRLVLPGWIASIVLQIVILAYFWQSGTAARLRDWLRRRQRSELAVRFQFGFVLGLLARVSALIPEFYLYRVARSMSLSDQLLRAWTLEWLIGALLTSCAIGIAVVLILWLVERTHQWYVYVIAGIFIVTYGATFLKPFVSPFYDRFAALPPAAAQVVRRIERRAGHDVPVVAQARSRSHLGAAYVEGVGPSQRIVLSDSLLAAASAPELRYIVAQQLGYVDGGDAFRLALLDALWVVIGSALAVAVADRIGFRRDDDPVARLALVAALLGVAYLAVVPFYHAAQRRIARETQTYALELTRQPAAAVRTIVRASDQSLRSVCASPIDTFFLERTDDPAHRVAAANHVPPTCT